MALKTTAIFVFSVIVILGGDFTKSEDSCNPVSNDVYITPCVKNVTVKIGDPPPYRIIFCHTYNFSRPVAWYHKDQLVTTDTFEPFYQVYQVQTNQIYPASLAISNRMQTAITGLRCDGVVNGTLDDSHGAAVNLTVISYVEVMGNVSISVVVTPSDAESTEAFCFSIKKYDVAWHFGNTKVTTNTSERVYQELVSKNGYNGAVLVYKKASESEAGCYICKSTILSDDSNCVNVTAYVPANLEIFPDQKYFEFQRMLGVNLEITCLLDDIRPYEISWYRGNDRVTENTHSVVRQISHSSNNKSLVIDSNVGFSYSGVYQCVAAWDVHEDYVEIELNVKGDFVLNLSPDVDHLAMVEDEYPTSFDVLCYSSLDVSISWYFKGASVSRNTAAAVFQEQAAVNESTLHIQNSAPLEMRGCYTCKEVSSVGGLTVSINVEIYEQVSSSISLIEGSEEAWSWFTASASVAEIPGSSLSWYFNGVEVSNNSVEDVFQFTSSAEAIAYASLVISNHAPNFVSGNYVCMAMDKVNQQAATISVSYTGYAALSLSVDGESIHVTSGSQLTIECDVSAGVHALSWSENTRVIPTTSSSSVYQIIDNYQSKATLKIQSSASVANSGMYTCAVIDSDGVQSIQIYIHIDPIEDLGPGDVAAIVLGMLLFAVICVGIYSAYDIKRSGLLNAWFYKFLLRTNRIGLDSEASSIINYTPEKKHPEES